MRYVQQGSYASYKHIIDTDANNEQSNNVYDNNNRNTQYYTYNTIRYKNTKQ